jgi:hypothetical protein
VCEREKERKRERENERKRERERERKKEKACGVCAHLTLLQLLPGVCVVCVLISTCCCYFLWDAGGREQESTLKGQRDAAEQERDDALRKLEEALRCVYCQSKEGCRRACLQ